MSISTALAGSRAARAALRARLVLVAPDGLVWLDSAELEHPEARRTAQLPFPFVIGRITAGAGKHTVREAELVLESLAPDEDAAAALTSYARFVLSKVPTVHARLTGRVLSAWREQVGA